MNEAEFLANVSRRLRRPTPATAPTRSIAGAPAFWTEPAAHAYDPVEKFKTELVQLGGSAESFVDSNGMLHYLSDLLASLRPSRVGIWGEDFEESFGLTPCLADYEVVHWGQHGVASFQDVDVSITGCLFGIADTGTVVLGSAPARGRSTSILPPVHIVLLHAAQIRRRMGEVLEEISALRDRLPSSLHFISGPSRSSDIENDQTIGIHGPAAVMALILI